MNFRIVVSILLLIQSVCFADEPGRGIPKPQTGSGSYAIVTFMAGALTFYSAKAARESWTRAKHWNLEEQIRIQREKEANAKTLRAKIIAFRDGLSVNKWGKVNAYIQATSFSAIGTFMGFATLISFQMTLAKCKKGL